MNWFAAAPAPVAATEIGFRERAICHVLAALLVTVRAHFGETRAWVSLLGGAAAGAAVLTRYQHASAILVMFAVVALAAVRQRRLTPVLWFAAGGLPFAALLFGTNYLRFRDLANTDYPPTST